MTFIPKLHKQLSEIINEKICKGAPSKPPSLNFSFTTVLPRKKLKYKKF